MKLTNTTDFPDHFLRKLLSWCCKQTGCRYRDVKEAKFAKRSGGCYSGRAWESGRILVKIGPPEDFPVKGTLYPGRKSEAFRAPDMQDQYDALVAVTAHELTHIREFSNENRYGERKTRYEERRAVEAFNENRDALLAEWMAEPAKRITARPLTRQEKNDRNTRELLKKWERKLKSAQTKVKKYRAKVRYYDRVAAAKSRPK